MNAHPPANFEACRSRVIRLYREEGYAEALQVVLNAAPRFPEHASEIALWQACLHSVTGAPDKALDDLRIALNNGCCWHPATLRDPDLNLIRDRGEFHDILKRSALLIESLDDMPHPDPVVLTPRAIGPKASGLIALHGADGNEHFIEHWRAASETGAIVAIPLSSRHQTREHLWWGDPAGGVDLEYARGQLAELRNVLVARYTLDPRQIILGGFSQGGRLAITLALRQDPVPARGFVCVAPALRDLAPLRELLIRVERSDLRGWLLTGNEDWCLGAIKEFHGAMTARGLACELVVIDGLGHAFPEAFEDYLRSAVRFVTAEMRV